MQSGVLRTALLGIVALSGLVPAPIHAAGEKINIEMKDRDGKSLGTVELQRTSAGALLKVKLAGLSPGPHGFHFHETGKCEGDFSSAGAIYNPLGAVHGFFNEEGPMAGDLTNIFADASGQVEVELLSPLVTMSKDGDDTIFDTDGTSLVIFEKPDDYLSEDGTVGARIACGAIPPTAP